MSSAACTILGASVLALLLAGYLAQHFLPPPKPKIIGIDLGTTYSCIGIYHAVTGDVDILEDEEGHKCIPSIVAFSEDSIVVGYKAEAQSEHNSERTIYDAKRFIGRHVSKEELLSEAKRYPFKMVLSDDGSVSYDVVRAGNVTKVTPEEIGAHIVRTLKGTAERNLSTSVTKVVLSVPAEFNEQQRNFTRKAARLAGLDVLRVINEPTAAALAYGLHKKEDIRNVLVVDLGGGTLDVSLLYIQGGMFSTQAMAGNNHLGGQDFNNRLLRYVMEQVELQFGRPLTDLEDIQSLRLAVETAKLRLTEGDSAKIDLQLHSFKNQASVTSSVTFTPTITREVFEKLNLDLFQKVLDPVRLVLTSAEMPAGDVDEIVLVGGSTRIPRIRQLIRDFFDKEPNVSVDPELAVATGVAIQAGILGGMWPLTVSALELPTKVQKIHVH